MEPGSRAEIELPLENTGRSPAEDMRVWASMAIENASWLPTDGILTDPTERAVTVIGPGQIRGLPLKLGGQLNPETVAGISKGTVRVYYFGRVTYRDRFDTSLNSRDLRFCLYYQPATGNLPANLTFCTTYNSVR
jgi:hypothetical protein